VTGSDQSRLGSLLSGVVLAHPPIISRLLNSGDSCTLDVTELEPYFFFFEMESQRFFQLAIVAAKQA